MNASTEQHKRTLEDFKKLGASLHQQLNPARVTPTLLKLQPQPDREDLVFEAMKNIGKPRHAFTDPEPDDMSRLMRKQAVSAAGSSFFTKREPVVKRGEKVKVKVKVATKEQK